MPQFRDLTVWVTDSAGNELEEWGVQHLRSQNKASAYIQAITNMAFKVTVRPTLPFQDPDFSMVCHNDLIMDGQLGLKEQEEPTDEFESRDLRENSHLIKKEKLISNNSLNITYNHRRTRSYNRFSNRHDRKSGPSNKSTSISSPMRSQAITNNSSPPPFHLLASLFLDGRQKAERKVVVYLDSSDQDFAGPDGKVTFRSRWVQGNDGSLKEHSWVFKDVGIETVFDKMLINGGDDCAEIREELDEDIMVAAMTATDLGVERNVEEDKSNIGQILVVIERVILGPKWMDKHYCSKHQEGEEIEDVDMAGVKNEITHTTGLEHTGTRSSRPIRVVSYFPYREGEKPYATFQYFYRSRETLEKFEFPGFPRSSRLTARGRRYMENTFATVTPLSIAHPVPVSKRKGRSFEESIKEGIFSEAEKKYKCSDTYRQLAAIKVNSNSLSQRKHLPSTTSTLPLIKSPPTSTRKRRVQVLETSDQGEEQHSGIENGSVRRKGFNAEQTSQAAVHVSSLSKHTKSSANTFSSSALVSFIPYSSTQGMSTNLATKCLKAGTQEGALKSTSLVLGPIDTKAAAELSKISCSGYRGSGQASDADDERDESDIDRLIGSIKNAGADHLNGDSVVPSPDQDDQGLHTKFQGMLLIPSKKRRTKEEIKDESNSESSATSPSKYVETKMERSPSKLGLSSGTAEDADEEDNATKENCPPVEKVGLLLLQHHVKRAKH